MSGNYPLGRTRSIVNVYKNPNALQRTFSLPSLGSYARTCSLYKPKAPTYYTGVYYPKKYYRDFRVYDDYVWEYPPHRSYYFRSPHYASYRLNNPSRFYTKDSWYPYKRYYDPYGYKDFVNTYYTPNRSYLYNYLL